MDNLEALLQLARQADDKGYSASACELYRKIIAQSPERNSAIYRLVKNLVELGKTTEAEHFLKKIDANAAPNPWLIEFAFGEIRYAQFRILEAENHFKKASLLNPTSTSPAVLYAHCLIKQEKFEEAFDVLTKAVTAEGDVEEVFLNLGIIKRAVGDYHAAKVYLQKALQACPNYKRAEDVLADVNFILDSRTMT